MWFSYVQQQEDGNFVMGDIQEKPDSPLIKNLSDELVTGLRKPHEKAMFYVCKNYYVLNAFMMGIKENFTIFDSKDFLQR